MFGGDTIELFYQRIYALLRTDIITFGLADIDYMMPFELTIYMAQLKVSIEQIKAERQKQKR